MICGSGIGRVSATTQLRRSATTPEPTLSNVAIVGWSTTDAQSIVRPSRRGGVPVVSAWPRTIQKELRGEAKRRARPTAAGLTSRRRNTRIENVPWR